MGESHELEPDIARASKDLEAGKGLLSISLHADQGGTDDGGPLEAWHVPGELHVQSLSQWADLEVVTRSVALLAALVFACGTPAPGEEGTTASTRESTVVPTLTPSTIVEATSITTAAVTTSVIAESPRFDDAFLVDLGLTPGTPISQSGGLPSLEQLVAGLDQFYLFAPPPRVQAISRIDLQAVEGQTFAAGTKTERLEVTVTHVDEVSVWDYPDGRREVEIDSGSTLVLTESNEWQEGRRQYPEPLALADWTSAKIMTMSLFGGEGTEIIGAEELVGMPTFRLRTVLEGYPVEFWVGPQLEPIRIIIEIALEDIARGHTVWDVQTFDPELTGPLPPGTTSEP